MIALLMEFATRRMVRVEGDPRLVMAPGSVLKPVVLDALLGAGRLRENDGLVCPLRLTIDGREFGCVHPRMAEPLTVPTAIAYSCNNYVARKAGQAAAAGLDRALVQRGFAPERVLAARTEAQAGMQALGEWGIRVTPEELLFAYRALAAGGRRAILEGLEGAVEFGTAQLARVPGVKVAGKTGTAAGNAAWFAGFAPSRAPKYVVVVLTGGKSGGADAAPLAGRILREALA